MKKYLEKLQSKGIYTFTREGVKSNCPVSASGVNMSIARYMARGEIARVKKNFYVILPPEYRKAGMLPPFWFMDDLMSYMGVNYYVGLTSAAAVYGAAHQQPQVFQVISDRQVKGIAVKGLRVEFIVKSGLVPERYIENKKTETGNIRVACPELICFDLARYIFRSGGLSNASGILAELQSSLDEKKLVKLAGYHQKAIYAQRLGYLFEKTGAAAAAALERWLKGKKTYPVYLIPGNRKCKARLDKKWNVLVNSQFETDAI
ncbi:MAG: type IV toxin-antitoxin system AbiEi family antitoxin [Elusimicrobiota bacterium]|nr:type IV toxin-antitoxin system AbiEi family antitoxin [Elusimicrobiota bacterium]